MRAAGGGGTRGRDSISEVHGSAAFTYIITIPGRNFDGDIALYDALATQAGLESQARRHIEAVRFVVVHFGEVIQALRNDHVTGSAGAISTAGVFEMNAKMEANVQQGLGFAVFGVRQLSRLILHGFPVNGNFWHVLLYR